MEKKIDRLSILNKILISLTAPKLGDKIKFRIIGQGDKIHKGKIAGVRKSKRGIEYKIKAENMYRIPTGPIEIIECNGKKFRMPRVKEKVEDHEFKPL